MPEKNVNINFNTKSDNSGAEKAKKANEEVKKSIDEVNSTSTKEVTADLKKLQEAGDRVLESFDNLDADGFKANLEEFRKEADKLKQEFPELPREFKKAIDDLEQLSLSDIVKDFDEVSKKTKRLPPLIKQTSKELPSLEKAAKKARSEMKVLGEESDKTGGSLKKIESLQVASALGNVISSAKSTGEELFTVTERLKETNGSFSDVSDITLTGASSVLGFASAIKTARLALGPVGVALAVVSTALAFLSKAFDKTGTKAEEAAKKEANSATEAYKAAKKRREAAKLAEEAAELARQAVEDLTEEWDKNVKAINRSTEALKDQVSAQDSLLDEQVQLAITRIRVSKNLTDQQKLEAIIAVKSKSRQIKQDREQLILNREITDERNKQEEARRSEDSARDKESQVPDLEAKNEELRRQVAFLKDSDKGIKKGIKEDTRKLSFNGLSLKRDVTGTKRDDFKSDEDFLKAFLRESRDNLKDLEGDETLLAGIDKKALNKGIKEAESLLKRINEIPKAIAKQIREREKQITENNVNIKAGEEATNVIEDAINAQKEAVRRRQKLESEKSTSQRRFDIRNERINLTDNFDRSELKETEDQKLKKQQEDERKRNLLKQKQNTEGNLRNEEDDVVREARRIIEQVKKSVNTKSPKLKPRIFALENALDDLSEDGSTQQELDAFRKAASKAIKNQNITKDILDLMRFSNKALGQQFTETEGLKSELGKIREELQGLQDRERNGR